MEAKEEESLREWKAMISAPRPDTREEEPLRIVDEKTAKSIYGKQLGKLTCETIIGALNELGVKVSKKATAKDLVQVLNDARARIAAGLDKIDDAIAEATEAGNAVAVSEQIAKRFEYQKKNQELAEQLQFLGMIASIIKKKGEYLIVRRRDEITLAVPKLKARGNSLIFSVPYPIPDAVMRLRAFARYKVPARVGIMQTCKGHQYMAGGALAGGEVREGREPNEVTGEGGEISGRFYTGGQGFIFRTENNIEAIAKIRDCKIFHMLSEKLAEKNRGIFGKSIQARKREDVENVRRDVSIGIDEIACYLGKESRDTKYKTAADLKRTAAKNGPLAGLKIPCSMNTGRTNVTGWVSVFSFVGIGEDGKLHAVYTPEYACYMLANGVFARIDRRSYQLQDMAYALYSPMKELEPIQTGDSPDTICRRISLEKALEWMQLANKELHDSIAEDMLEPFWKSVEAIEKLGIAKIEVLHQQGCTCSKLNEKQERFIRNREGNARRHSLDELKKYVVEIRLLAEDVRADDVKRIELKKKKKC